MSNAKQKVPREVIWQEIKAGKRKMDIFFPHANTSLTAGILSVTSLLHLGFPLGAWALYSGLSTFNDPDEKAIKKYRVKARFGVTLGVLGLLLNVLTWIITNG